jgi:hypothetical protein
VRLRADFLSRGACAAITRRIEIHKASAAAREHYALLVADLRRQEEVAPLGVGLPSFDDKLLPRPHRPKILDVQFRRNGARLAKTIGFAHHFVEQGGDDAAVKKSSGALEVVTQAEPAANAAGRVVLFEGELQAAWVRTAAAKAAVVGLRRQKYVPSPV